MLSPTAFLSRGARVFADRPAIVDEGIARTYAEFHDRAERLASALLDAGVKPGDRVAVLATNSYVMLEAHHGIPLCGAVLVPLNTRLTHEEQVSQLRHAGTRLLIATREFAERAKALGEELHLRLMLEARADDSYDAQLDAASASGRRAVSDTGLLSISYTSGTTGEPKGVMHSHRGAYLQTVAMAYHGAFTPDTRYLWTLPMFHCHGWCNTWAVTAAGGTHICMRTFTPEAAWHALDRHKITHMSAAPTVLIMLLAEQSRAHVTRRAVRVSTGGAPPTPTLIQRMESAGLTPQHLYGLTETLGPSLVNEWQAEWNALSPQDRAWRHARQGIPTVAVEARVLDAQGIEVARDGVSPGEIVIRGETVTSGYFENPTATRNAIRDGWLHTGDVGVVHPDGYMQVTDRLKDIIISGGENISSVEIERAIDSYPGVIESAVVAAPHPKWGEQPVAFIHAAAEIADMDLIAHLRERVAGFKLPKHFYFGDLPKTATGKVRKDVLRGVAATATAADDPTAGPTR